MAYKTVNGKLVKYKTEHLMKIAGFKHTKGTQTVGERGSADLHRKKQQAEREGKPVHSKHATGSMWTQFGTR